MGNEILMHCKVLRTENPGSLYMCDPRVKPVLGGGGGRARTQEARSERVARGSEAQNAF